MTGAEHATGTLSVMGQGLRLGVVDDHPAILRGVLALLIGIRLLVWGVLQLAIAFQLRSLTN